MVLLFRDNFILVIKGDLFLFGLRCFSEDYFFEEDVRKLS